MRNLNLSLACLPGKHVLEAVSIAKSMQAEGKLVDPVHGSISLETVQLVPQSFGTLGLQTIEAIKSALPSARFRLHANVPVAGRGFEPDLSNARQYEGWFKSLKGINDALGSPVYTLHSGLKSATDLQGMIDNARWLEELLGCTVGIEGQYPDKHDKLLMSSWKEYEKVFLSGLSMAIDLSHLNIVRHHNGGQAPVDLISAMLESPQCVEVHLSENNGCGDWHQTCTKKAWWHGLLDRINPDAVIFSEGNLLRSRAESH